MDDKKFKVVTIVALVVAVLGLTIGYASYATTLTISGKGTINAATWDVSFIGDAIPSHVNHGVAGTPTLTGTTVDGLTATLNMPGDSVSYTFTVKNNGQLNAILKEVTGGAKSCEALDIEGESATTEEVNALCDDITYTLKYSDETEITPDTPLNVGEEKKLKATFTWDSKSTATTSGGAKINVTPTTLVYEQAQ